MHDVDIAALYRAESRKPRDFTQADSLRIAREARKNHVRIVWDEPLSPDASASDQTCGSQLSLQR